MLRPRRFAAVALGTLVALGAAASAAQAIPTGYATQIYSDATSQTWSGSCASGRWNGNVRFYLKASSRPNHNWDVAYVALGMGDSATGKPPTGLVTLRNFRWDAQGSPFGGTETDKGVLFKKSDAGSAAFNPSSVQPYSGTGGMEAKWWFNSTLGERLFDGYRIGFEFGGTSVGDDCYVWMNYNHAL